jgi:hypothetical protein
MYNLAEDPYEQVNLAHSRRTKLLALREQWVADTGDKFPLPES